MHVSRWTILAGAAVSAAALLLTFVESPLLGRIDGWGGSAWPALVLVAIPFALALVGDRAEGFTRSVALAAIAAALVAVVFAVAKLVDALLAVDEAVRITGDGSVGAGPWVLLGGCLVVAAGTLLSLSRRVR